MAFTKETYKELEAVVGSRNISDDMGVRESYRCIASQSSAHYGPYSHWTPCPKAVIMPGSAEEVQKIAEICNKYGVQFKASSTFWSVMGYIGSDCAVQLDMRSMRSIEIDPVNQIATIEPYAIAAAVQAEAMKYGLNLNIPGVGCSSSPVASAAGWMGAGPATIFMGVSGENLICAEWVLPDGRLVRTGSAGAGEKWFCGKSAGPDARAVMRGHIGTMGSMGVCTKISMRLHPWPGPDIPETYGTAPAYKSDMGDNIRCYTCCFPDWESWTKAIVLFQECDVAYLGHRQFNMFGRDLKAAMIRILTDPDKQLCDLPELVADPEIRKQNDDMKIDFQLVIAGMTEKDMEYKEAAVNKILELSGGHKNEMMLEKDIHDWALMYLIRLGHKNLNYAMCGAYEGAFGLSGNVHVATPLMEEASALKRKWEQETDYIVANGGDSEMGGFSIIGGGGPLAWEYFTNFDAYDKKSVEGTCRFIDATHAWQQAHKLGPDFGRTNSGARRKDGYDYTQEEQDAMNQKMPQPWVMAYQYKIREAFNPNNLGGSNYRTLNPEKLK